MATVNAARIAVTGRHWLKANLASQAAMKASAPTMVSSARRRAFSTMPRRLAAATWRAMGFQFCGEVATHIRASSVCAGVRVALVKA